MFYICKLNRLIFLISILILVFSFPAYAITPYSDVTFNTFGDGPWAGQRVALFGVSSSGSTTKYAVPTWRDGSDAGDAYYNVSFSTTYLDGYIMSKDGVLNNICIVSYDPLVELYALDYMGNQISNILEDAFIASSGSRYFYGISVQNGTGVSFRASSTVMMTEFSSAFNGGSYYEFVNNNLPFVSGIYDGNSVAVRYPGMLYDSLLSTGSTFGFNYLYFPVVVVPGGGSDRVTTWYFNYGDGVLHADSNYTFNFKVSNITNGRIFISDPSDFIGATVSGGNFTASIVGQDVSLSNLGFGFRRSSASLPLGICFKYISSSSDDVGTLPPDDSGGGSSGSPDYSAAIGQIGSTLKELLSNQDSSTTTIVNNITNATTTISNTITNTTQQITNTITNGVSSITNSLQSVEQGISNKLGEVQEGLSNKLHEVEEGINSQLKDTTDEIVNGFDNSTMESEANKLDDSISEYDEAEQSVIQNFNDSLNDFEFDAELGEYQSIVSVVSDFLQQLYESSGGFKVLINLSMLLSLAGIVIGIYRFGGGS